jgi:anti-sigma factor RsiW
MGSEGAVMECTAVKKCLSRKIDGELTAGECAQVDAHLAQCASCMREYRLLALPRQIAEAIPALTPSPYFYQPIRARIEGESQGLAVWQVFYGLTRRVIPVMAGITLALLSVFAYLQMRVPETDIYTAYASAIVSEDRSSRLLVEGRSSITDEGVLRAIAERSADYERDLPLKK